MNNTISSQSRGALGIFCGINEDHDPGFVDYVKGMWQVVEEVSWVVLVVVQILRQICLPCLVLGSELGGEAGKVGLRNPFQPGLDLVHPVWWLRVCFLSDLSQQADMFLPKVQIARRLVTSCTGHRRALSQLSLAFGVIVLICNCEHRPLSTAELSSTSCGSSGSSRTNSSCVVD